MSSYFPAKSKWPSLSNFSCQTEVGDKSHKKEAKKELQLFVPIQTKFVFSFKGTSNICPSVPCQTEEAKGHQACLICSSQKAKEEL